LDEPETVMNSKSAQRMLTYWVWLGPVSNVAGTTGSINTSFAGREREEDLLKLDYTESFWRE